MELNRNSEIPLYEQLKQIIEYKILSGELECGAQIPSERELCAAYGISRITVRQAIALAEREGLLYRNQGRGTFVIDMKIKQGLPKVSSFHQTLSQQGLIVFTKIIEEEILQNNFYFSKILHVDMMEQIKNIKLIGCGNDHPVVFYDSYFPLYIGEKMARAAREKTKKQVPFSTLSLYQEIQEIPTHIEQTFEAINADFTIADALQIAHGSAILLATSIVYNHQKPLEIKKAYYRGDKYKFFIQREFDILA